MRRSSDENNRVNRSRRSVSSSLHRSPIPEIRLPNDILVRIHATGVNPIDVKLKRRGSLFTENLPVVPRYEGTGVIETVGSAVTNFSRGDPSFFLHGGFGDSTGTSAERTTVPEVSL